LATPRIYLTGRVSIEHGDILVDERRLSGRQGRLAFVFLAVDRHRMVSRDELVSAIWPHGPPKEVETALSAILSKLRAALKKAGLRRDDAGIDVRLGSIELHLPPDAWIDVEAGANAADEAEGALRSGDRQRAWSLSNVVVSITRRPFLPDEEAPWIQSRRSKLRAFLVRGLQCLSTISAAQGEESLALQYASEMVEIEPFRETAYQHLMRLHAQMGNRAEALRVFTCCRKLLKEELGASPSPETEALFLRILRNGSHVAG
jgi:SARP family transcriptional regulator, regulator of embCAB operon